MQSAERQESLDRAPTIDSEDGQEPQKKKQRRSKAGCLTCRSAVMPLRTIPSKKLTTLMHETEPQEKAAMRSNHDADAASAYLIRAYGLKHARFTRLRKVESRKNAWRQPRRRTASILKFQLLQPKAECSTRQAHLPQLLRRRLLPMLPAQRE